jgi:osmotically-inducible protein OsmY
MITFTNLTRQIRLPLLLTAGLLLCSGCAEMVVGVATGTVIVSDKRTLGATVEDQQIENSARRVLRSNPSIAGGNHMSFTSYNRVLLITGEVRDEQTRNTLDDLLRDIPNLRRIHNELTLAAPSSGMSRVSDTYLTAKVKTRLLLEKDLNANRFKIVSENGRVFIMGLCTRKDGAQAALVARKTAGVQAVITLFEYID